jgi:hypothetical protein
MTGPISCPETSVTDYQPKPRNIPEEQSSRLHDIETRTLAQYMSLYFPFDYPFKFTSKLLRTTQCVTFAIRLHICAGLFYEPKSRRSD